MKPAIVIKGGRLVDATGVRSGDVAIGDDGRIVAVGPDLAGEQVVDATGCVVSPGFVDCEAHLRQPGDEQAETIASGARAAAAGGYTCVLAMPDTDPVADTVGAVREINLLGVGAHAEVLPAAAITVGRAGTQLAPLAELAAVGVGVFTDAGTGVQDALLMRRAMEYASALDVTLALHCTDDQLAAGGHLNEGEWSSRLGMAGQPAEAEELRVVRDLALARLTGARVHFLQLSTAGSVAMVGAARAGGLAVTASVAPHHLALTDEACATYDAAAKVFPPLRTDADVRALHAAIASGELDCIVSAHEPHTPDEKELPFDEAPGGAVGLELTLAVALTHLDLPVEQVVALLSWKPAAILGVADRHGGPITEGALANLCVFDPDEEWTVDPRSLVSQSRNTPFAGHRLRGRVRHTMQRGRLVVHNGTVIP